jgi:asparagine synthase (glutamine-hydrolysing)
VAKLEHVYYCASPMSLYFPLMTSDDPEPVDPLISQPLFEVCMRTRTNVLIAGGINRSIARRAFSGRLPSEIVRRSTKGGMDAHARHVLVSNIDFIKELLLEGLLVKERFLVKEELELALNLSRPSSGADMSELFNYIGTEIWLRQWSRVPQKQTQLRFKRSA